MVFSTFHKYGASDLQNLDLIWSKTKAVLILLSYVIQNQNNVTIHCQFSLETCTLTMSTIIKIKNLFQGTASEVYPRVKEYPHGVDTLFTGEHFTLACM